MKCENLTNLYLGVDQLLELSPSFYKNLKLLQILTLTSLTLEKLEKALKIITEAKFFTYLVEINLECTLTYDEKHYAMVILARYLNNYKSKLFYLQSFSIINMKNQSIQNVKQQNLKKNLISLEMILEFIDIHNLKHLRYVKIFEPVYLKEDNLTKTLIAIASLKCHSLELYVLYLDIFIKLLLANPKAMTFEFTQSLKMNDIWKILWNLENVIKDKAGVNLFISIIEKCNFDSYT